MRKKRVLENFVICNQSYYELSCFVPRGEVRFRPLSLAEKQVLKRDLDLPQDLTSRSWRRCEC